ncbi:MAG: hypothetical protein IH819_12435, partial [Bacteroidetes bacterium]|nr:hypothetical protein [Bacteroidota bacterium]
MKKIGLLFILLFLATLHSQTLLLEDNLDYSIGVLATVSANWTESPTGSVDIKVVSGNLTFSNYPSSGIGNKIILDGGAS